jgi:hypothetical protein
MEKKMNARLSNDENGGTLLKKRLEEMEKEFTESTPHFLFNSTFSTFQLSASNNSLDFLSFSIS